MMKGNKADIWRMQQKVEELSPFSTPGLQVHDTCSAGPQKYTGYRIKSVKGKVLERFLESLQAAGLAQACLLQPGWFLGSGSKKEIFPNTEVVSACEEQT